GKKLLDFGLGVEPGVFEFRDTSCLIPSSYVLAYALAVAASGKARRILMAGFDGYLAGDPRNEGMNGLLALSIASPRSTAIVAILPTVSRVPQRSIYGM